MKRNVSHNNPVMTYLDKYSPEKSRIKMFDPARPGGGPLPKAY